MQSTHITCGHNSMASNSGQSSLNKSKYDKPTQEKLIKFSMTLDPDPGCKLTRRANSFWMTH